MMLTSFDNNENDYRMLHMLHVLSVDKVNIFVDDLAMVGDLKT